MLLSRLAVGRTGGVATLYKSAVAQTRVCHQVAADKDYKREPLNIPESPERDVVNYPRIKRPEYPGKVRMGFIPDEWFQFFYNKTGVTGPYVFGLGFTTYLLSKEIYVLEHEFYTGVSIFIMALYSIKKFGPSVAAYLDKSVDDVENRFKQSRETSLSSIKSNIASEELSQEQAKGMGILFQAKKENVLLQLEAAFRQRQMSVYSEVKKRLDYQLEKQNVQRRMEQKHMVNWIVNGVVKNITAQQEKEALQKCFTDLKSLAARAQAIK